MSEVMTMNGFSELTSTQLNLVNGGQGPGTPAYDANHSNPDVEAANDTGRRVLGTEVAVIGFAAVCFTGPVGIAFAGLAMCCGICAANI